MQHVIKAFRHNADGSWTCIAPTTFDGPSGRIQVTPGTKFVRGDEFMGVDLAKWLDEQDAKDSSGRRRDK